MATMAAAPPTPSSFQLPISPSPRPGAAPACTPAVLSSTCLSQQRRNLNLRGPGTATRFEFIVVRRSREKCGLRVVCQASRDRVLEFGRFKGSMLGMMSSKYLKWMAKNLKNGSMSEWSGYAEEVLADPHYRDRLEWEQVEKLMTVAHDFKSLTGNKDVLAPAKMFGWNLDDDSGWRKVNFTLLGTSKGGRIPRVSGVLPPVGEKARQPQKKPIRTVRTRTVSLLSPNTSSSLPDDDSSSSGSLRDELIRRRARRREKVTANGGATTDGDDQPRSAPFPGRQGLLSTVRSYDISE